MDLFAHLSDQVEILIYLALLILEFLDTSSRLLLARSAGSLANWVLEGGAISVEEPALG